MHWKKGEGGGGGDSHMYVHGKRISRSFALTALAQPNKLSTSRLQPPDCTPSIARPKHIPTVSQPCMQTPKSFDMHSKGNREPCARIPFKRTRSNDVRSNEARYSQETIPAESLPGICLSIGTT